MKKYFLDRVGRILLTTNIVIILSFSFTFLTQTSAENIFDDVYQNTNFYESIQYAKENGIVNGYSDGTFRPENKINRAEFLKVILLSVYSQTEIQNYPIQDIVFNDTSPKAWFYNYSQFAFNQGIIKGYPDNTFRPYKNISLAEALKIIFKTKNINTEKMKGNWYNEFIEKAKKTQLLKPEGEIKNNPLHEITRGEMVWLIHTLAKNNKKDIKKLGIPQNNNIYFGAFPDFGGSENNVTKDRIKDFEKQAGKKIIWAYFSQNWFNGIKYPKESIHTINDEGIIPFVRLMPRSDEEQFKKENKFSLDNIINGKFDKELKQWAKDSKEDNIPLLVDFAVEMNGDWFSWSGIYNGKGSKNNYGDLDYPDGPEKYRDAYRHIIDIFRKENATNITWFFHPDIYSNPNVEWNKAKYYYPGDEYIDWLGISIYGPLHPKEDYWEIFNEILKNKHKSITEISENKPIALLEFGVTDNHPLGNKSEWLDDAFKTILNNPYIDFKAISYWHENWEEEDNLWATLRIDSSKESLKMFQKYTKNPRFISTPISLKNLNKKISFKKNIIETNKPQKKGYKPKPKTSWQWQLAGEINTNYEVKMYDIDLEETPQETIDVLHKQDKKVICYFNGGAYEPYRSDSEKFPKESLGKIMDGWEDEKWLDVANYEKFADIIKDRLDLAVLKKCDGVEPDNMDGFQNDSGFPLTYEDQLKYNKWIAEEAHKRGLSIGLKNDLDQIEDLVDYFDFLVNEQCFQYGECDLLTPFIQNNKAVFNAEYELELNEFCEQAKELKFSALKMEYDLDGGRLSCDEE